MAKTFVVTVRNRGTRSETIIGAPAACAAFLLCLTAVSGRDEGKAIRWWARYAPAGTSYTACSSHTDEEVYSVRMDRVQ